MYQVLLAVSTKLLPYETIIACMTSTKWDLKEIPCIHSTYVDAFVQELNRFSVEYGKLIAQNDLKFLNPKCSPFPDDGSSPLLKLNHLSTRLSAVLWECIVRISNRCFVEGFSCAKKCTNEGRALMQLDYQQFLSNCEKIISPFLATDPLLALKNARATLANEKEFVEEYIKAMYLTEPVLVDWLRHRPEYSRKQIVALVNCVSSDNKKLRTSLMATIADSNSSADSFSYNDSASAQL